VIVQRALTRGKAGRVLGAPKTTQSRRTIPLPGSTTQALREHKAQQAEQRLAAGPAYDNQDYVFAGPLGLPLPDRTLTEHFKRILAAAGLPTTIRWYDLRHTTVSLRQHCLAAPPPICHPWCRSVELPGRDE
jgi:integrase